jgi:hypothetical protein
LLGPGEVTAPDESAEPVFEVALSRSKFGKACDQLVSKDADPATTPEPGLFVEQSQSALGGQFLHESIIDPSPPSPMLGGAQFEKKAVDRHRWDVVDPIDVAEKEVVKAANLGVHLTVSLARSRRYFEGSLFESAEAMKACGRGSADRRAFAGPNGQGHQFHPPCDGNSAWGEGAWQQLHQFAGGQTKPDLPTAHTRSNSLSGIEDSMLNASCRLK